MKQTLAVLLLLFTIPALRAGVLPSPPTSVDALVYQVDAPCGGYGAEAPVVTGNEIRIRLRATPGACTPAVVTHRVPVGRLAPGTYKLTYERLSASGTLESTATETFTVIEGSGRAKLLSLGSGTVVRINPRSGLVQSLGTIACCQLGGPGAFDPVSRHLFYTRFLGLTDLGVGVVLVRTDVANMTTREYQTFLHNVDSFELDRGRLIAVVYRTGRVASERGVSVISIDPENGAVTNLVNTGLLLSPAISTFDPEQRRLYIVAGAEGLQQLITVDVVAGTFVTRPFASPSQYLFIEFDPLSGGLLAVTTAPGMPVVHISPATGVVQTILPTGLTTGRRASSAFDPSLRELYFLSGDQVVTVNLLTSTVTAATRSAFAGLFLELAANDFAADVPIGGAGLALLVSMLAFAAMFVLRRAG